MLGNMLINKPVIEEGKTLSGYVPADLSVMDHVFEVDIPGWSVVDFITFRSWAGRRKVDGIDFVGPVYFYLSNKKIDRDKTNHTE